MCSKIAYIQIVIYCVPLAADLYLFIVYLFNAQFCICFLFNGCAHGDCALKNSAWLNQTQT